MMGCMSDKKEKSLDQWQDNIAEKVGKAWMKEQKKDQGKIPLNLLPLDALTEIAKVLQFGAQKYAPRGWEKGIEYDRVFGATLRHLFAWHQGEDTDPESQLNHLSHAACEILFLLAFVTRGRVDLDDRPCKTPK